MGVLARKLLAPSSSGIQFVGGNGGTQVGATAGSVSVSLTALTGGIGSQAIANDLVIALFTTGSQADRILSITTGYTLIGSELYVNEMYDINFRIAYKFMPSTPDTDVTIGNTGNANDAGAHQVMVYRGVDLVTPLDVAAVSATGIDTAVPNPAAITPATGGAVIVVAAGSAHNATTGVFTASQLSEFVTRVQDDTFDTTLGIGNYYDWVSGSFDPNAWTFSGADVNTYSWAAMTIALRPA